jgi:anti-sigma-K factor RskA
MSTDQHTAAVSYLLGELETDEAAAFERALAADPALRAEVERLRPVVGRLGGLPREAWTDELEPPPLRLTVPDPPPASVAPARRRRPAFGWRGPLVVHPALAAVLALALLAGGIGLGTLLDGGGESVPAGPTLALDPLPDGAPGARGRVLVSDESREVTVRVERLPPTGNDAFYELWLLSDDGRLVALGSFRVDRAGAARLRVPLPVDPGGFQYFDVSLEPADGNASHSGRSVLRGPTRA